jgi:signal peptidase I
METGTEQRAEQPAPVRQSRLERMGLSHGQRVALDWILTIVGAITIVVVIKLYAINPYRIPSSSMEPTLHCARPGSGCEARFSDRVLANRFLYHLHPPRRTDIVVFKTPPLAEVKCGAGGTFVKRLIGLPGDTVTEDNGIVSINGKRLDESYIKPDRRDSEPPRTWPKIAPDHYFFMGDNRRQSCDSRSWGTVPRQNLIGEVFFVYWPPNRLGFR